MRARVLPAALAAAALASAAGCRSSICPWCGHDIRTRPPADRAETLPAGIVRGEATSLERGELHPLARVIVEMHDLSVFAGGKPRLVAETAIEQPRSLPVAFELAYPAGTVVAEHDYSVSARIVVGQTVVARTDTLYPVLTRGAPDRVQLVLMRVR